MYVLSCICFQADNANIASVSNVTSMMLTDVHKSICERKLVSKVCISQTCLADVI